MSKYERFQISNYKVSIVYWSIFVLPFLAYILMSTHSYLWFGSEMDWGRYIVAVALVLAFSILGAIIGALEEEYHAD